LPYIKIMKKLQIHIISYLFLLTAHVAFGQTNYSFHRLTINDGLSNSSVTYIMQDSKGFMWFATNDGLNRYDGYDFSIYRSNPQNHKSISDNKIECIFEDKQKNIWVGTTNGLNLYVRETDDFIRFLANTENKNSLSSNHVRKIMEDGNYLWIATLGGGVSRYDTKNKTFNHFKNDSTNSQSLCFDWVWTIYKDSQQRFWFGSLGMGIDLYKPETGEFQNFKFDTENQSTNRIRCILELSKNDFLIGTDAGLIRFTPDKKENNYRIYQSDPNNKTSVSGGHVRDIFRDNSGKIWVATQTGLNIYDEKFDTFFRLERWENDIYSLTADEIWDIEQDNQGCLWFGAYKGGINIFNTNQKHFHNWTFQPNNPKSLINNSVLSIEENPDSTLWIGIDHGGLSLFDRYTGTIKTYRNQPSVKNSLASDAILCMLNDNQNRLWLGMWAGGINKMDKKNETFASYAPSNIYFRDWNVWDLLEDSKGRIWAATFSGVSCYDTLSLKFTNYVHNADNPKSLSHDYVWTIFEDSKKNIWIGTTAGLNKFNEATGDFEYYPYSTNNQEEINSYTVYAIKEDKHHRLWIGTSGNGLNLFNPETKKFNSYLTGNNLIYNEIYAIEFDDSDCLWLSTNLGLVKMKVDENNNIVEQYNFDSGSGLRIEEFNIGASFKSQTGELFYGGSKGFVFFNPDSIRPNNFEPEVIITDFLIYNQKVQIDAEGKSDSPLQKHISETKEITLTYKQAIFSLKFSALSFISPEKNQYAYKLDGLEDEWNYVKNKRDATYTNLEAGEYTFMVKASNNDGIWSDKTTTLKIIVLPPWWKTWWFRLLSGGLVLFIAATIYIVRVKQLNSQKAELEVKVNERTAELQEVNCILEEKNMEISETSEIVKMQNEHIKSGIQYAKTIQNAILPSSHNISKHFEHFIIYQPKDIVSGDFYWFAEIGNKSNQFIFAVCDSTGHGVPGAFMSLIGSSILNSIIKEQKTSNPVDILNKLDIGLYVALQRDEKRSDDGMDVCLCKMEKMNEKDWKITFAGAKRHLLYYKKDEDKLVKMKSSIKSIGGGAVTSHIEFEETEILLHSGDILYFTTDGFTDQSNIDGERFSREGLNKLLSLIGTENMESQKLRLENELSNHKGKAKQTDDITIVGLKLI